MIENLEALQKEAQSKINSTKDLRELDLVRVEFLGKKGIVTAYLHQLGTMSPEERKQKGAQLNETKTIIESHIESRKREISAQSIAGELTSQDSIDLTLPGVYGVQNGSLHPLTQTMQEIVQILRRVGFSVANGPEIETEYYNFEALNTPESHPARDVQDTFYIKPPVLLRSHTSPVQIRSMLKQKPPIQIISLGRVYRSDLDATHSPMFHQVEGLLVSSGVSFADLKGVLHYLIKELFGERKLRFRPSFFPFTEPSAEVDMWFQDKWLEIGGCGMVHPNVLRTAGYDPDEVNGYAFGMGIERITMLKFGLTDIRAFFQNDYRLLEQF